MDIAAKLTEAQVLRVAIIDDDLSERLSSPDLREESPGAAALLNDRADPDRVAYMALLAEQGIDPATLADLAEPLADAAIRAAAPARLRNAADAALASRAQRAEPVRRVIDLLKELGVAAANLDFYAIPQIGHDKTYDLVIVDYFLVDTSTDATLPFIREVLETHKDSDPPLQIILMSSHDERLKRDFKEIRPELKVSSSRMRIMEKPRTEAHLVAWRAALWQLASDRADVVRLERFVTEAGTALETAAKATAKGLWELDLQAADLLHELASKDHDDFVRYVEDVVSRRLLSALEADGGMRPALQQLDTAFAAHRPQNLLSPVAEVGDSRAAIHGLMHSMEWREGTPVLPAFPAGAAELEQARWVQKHVRFGAVLRDPQGGEWLNITQACDLAQAKEADFAHSSVVLIRGHHTAPSETMNETYYVTMSAMMASSENHVLTWNLRDVRTQSIEEFGRAYGTGWQVIAELRPDRAQDIAAQFGARMARVGLSVTLQAWRLAGCAIRVGDLRDATATDALAGMGLTGYAIQRPKAKSHELHLDRASVDALVTAYTALGAAIVNLLTGLTIKPGSKLDVGGQVVCAYKTAPPATVEEARQELAALLAEPRNANKILILLWSAP